MEPVLPPPQALDSQGSFSVVSLDCTSSCTQSNKLKKLQRDNARLKRRNGILVQRIKLHTESETFQHQLENDLLLARWLLWRGTLVMGLLCPRHAGVPFWQIVVRQDKLLFVGSMRWLQVAGMATFHAQQEH